jgi:glycosyltransferase involved in cell wall biosynthesis
VRILFAAPAWYPSHAFGGPVVAARELVRRLVQRGHEVGVLTTTIADLHQRPAARSSTQVVDGASVHYLATPLRYRWMGITPTLPAALARQGPDVVHIFGFRDPVTTVSAAWCRLRRVPYVFEPLGMFEPRLRKVLLKRTLDATLYRGVGRGAAAVVTASERERDGVVACGIPAERVRVRGNGFPDVERLGSDPAPVRPRLGIPPDAPVVLYVGRIAAGKGIDHLLAAVRELPQAHLVLAGPDDRHGVTTDGDRVHRLPMTEEPPRTLYPQADVFVLPSEGESFGMVAAEAAAAGTPVIVSDRCGIAGFFDGEALVVPYEREAIVGSIRRVLTDAALRAQLRHGGPAAARRMSWDHVTDVQEAIYREALASRTAATKLSTEGS